MRLLWRALFVIFLVSAAPMQAEEWRRNVWHHVTESSPFYTKDRSQLHSAGVLQSDGRFALLVLGETGQGALVSVNMPGSDVATELESTLIMPAGHVLSRRVVAEQLLPLPTPDEDAITYSFGIAAADIETFMAARTWRVTTGDQTISVTLKGSRKAIVSALAARDKSP